MEEPILVARLEDHTSRHPTIMMLLLMNMVFDLKLILVSHFLYNVSYVFMCESLDPSWIQGT